MQLSFLRCSFRRKSVSRQRKHFHSSWITYSDKSGREIYHVNHSQASHAFPLIEGQDGILTLQLRYLLRESSLFHSAEVQNLGDRQLVKLQDQTSDRPYRASLKYEYASLLNADLVLAKRYFLVRDPW